MPRKKKDGQLDFEASLKKLEEIVRKLEDEQSPLEESLKLFAEGRELAKRCEKELQSAENRIRQLLEDEEGQVEETDFDEDEAEPPREKEPNNPPTDDKPSRTRDDLPF